MSCQTLNVIPLSINRNDLLTAIKKLKVLGSGFALIPVGQSYLVQSVPGELTMDHTTVLQQAQVSHVMSNCLYIYHTTGSGKSHHVYTSIMQQAQVSHIMSIHLSYNSHTTGSGKSHHVYTSIKCQVSSVISTVV